MKDNMNVNAPGLELLRIKTDAAEKLQIVTKL